MRVYFLSWMDQGVLNLVINSRKNLKNIINNKELPKTVSFVYTCSVGRPSHNIPKEWSSELLDKVSANGVHSMFESYSRDLKGSKLMQVLISFCLPVYC